MSHPPTCENSKNAWRRHAREIRKTLDMVDLSQKILGHLSSWTVFQKAKTVLSYYPYGDEINLLPLVGSFPEKAWYLPRVESETQLAFHQYFPDAPLQKGRYGITEPAAFLDQLDKIRPKTLVILPALMVDRHGIRLGYGKGYYDRFLAEALCQAPDLITIVPVPGALCYEALPRDTWDIPVHFLAHEGGIVSLGHLKDE